MNDITRTSKEEVIRWLHRINKQGGLGFDAHAALDNALLYLRGEPAKPSKEENTEALAWALQAHEDLAKMLADGGGNMLHVRANRALGILFAEVERLEKLLYPIGTAHEPPDGLSADRVSELLSKCILHAETGNDESAAFFGDLVVLIQRAAQPPAVGRGEPIGCTCRYVDGGDLPACHDDDCPALTKPVEPTVDGALKELRQRLGMGEPDGR